MRVQYSYENNAGPPSSPLPSHLEICFLLRPAYILTYLLWALFNYFTNKQFSNPVLKVFCFVITELLAKHYTTINAHVRKQFAQQLNVYCNKTVLDEGPEEPHQYQWTYYNAFFFALTTLSTIGKYYDDKRL